LLTPDLGAIEIGNGGYCLGHGIQSVADTTGSEKNLIERNRKILVSQAPLLGLLSIHTALLDFETGQIV